MKTYKDYLRENPEQAKLSDKTMINGVLRDPKISIKDYVKIKKKNKSNLKFNR